MSRTATYEESLFGVDVIDVSEGQVVAGLSGHR